MERKSNIVLIGMPGVGKSTVGVILAKMIGYNFLDADLEIQRQEGKLLKDIIEEQGTEGFIAVENRVNAGLCTEHTVIATGGSVIYGKEAMAHLKEIGTIIYLSVAFPALQKRLADIKGRGVVLKEGQDLKGLYEERTPMYEKYADYEICEDNLSIEETVEKLLSVLSV